MVVDDAAEVFTPLVFVQDERGLTVNKKLTMPRARLISLQCGDVSTVEFGCDAPLARGEKLKSHNSPLIQFV